MTGERLSTRPCSDFITRLAQSPPMPAIEELIWNAFDENARNVNVDVEFNALGGASKITICDDGRGMSHANARSAFGDLGNSSKKNRKLDSGFQLHGSKGEGRLKALSLGGSVTWTFTYAESQRRYRFEITGTAGREDPFYLTSKEEVAEDTPCGCTVVIREITRSLAVLRSDDALRELTVQFAPFILKHSDRSLTYRGDAVNPASAIEKRVRLRAFDF